MKILLFELLSAVIWVTLTKNNTFFNFLSGFVLADVVLWFISSATRRKSFLQRVYPYVPFFLYFLKEYIASNIKIIREIWTPGFSFRPGIIAVPLQPRMNDLQIVCLANMITLTPGTFTMDVAQDHKCLYVHNMYIDTVQKSVDEIKNGFEKEVLETLK